MRYLAMTIAAMLALGAAAAIAGDDALVVYKSLSPEVALEAAQAALKQCAPTDSRSRSRWSTVLVRPR
jgi:hypothetical protein